MTTPVNHKHAMSSKKVTKTDCGPPVETLEIGTDLSDKGWSETPAGKSLLRRCTSIWKDPTAASEE